jgi:DNA-binding MarR family transcriptional regulator
MIRRGEVSLARKARQGAVPAFDLESHVFYLFTQIFGRRNRDLAETLKSFRLTVPQWRVLAVLNERPDCTMGGLADLTTIDRTTLTRTLDQMVRAGLVERGGDGRDRRNVRLRLTASGSEAFRLILPVVVEQNERAMRGIAPGERAALRRILHRMVRNLDPEYDERNAAWMTDQAASPVPTRRRKGDLA